MLQARRVKILDAKVEQELSHIKMDDEDNTDDDMDDKKPDVKENIKEQLSDAPGDIETNIKENVSDIKTEGTEIVVKEEEVKAEVQETKSEKTGDEIKAEDGHHESDIKEVVPEVTASTSTITTRRGSYQAKKRKTPSPVQYELKPDDYVFLDTISAKNLTEDEKKNGVLDISEALRTHRHYPKMAKPYSKLDNLLERRQRQWLFETRQKMIIDQVLLKYRVQNLQKKQALEEKDSDKKEGESSLNSSKTNKQGEESRNGSTVEDENVLDVEGNMDMTGVAELEDTMSQQSDESQTVSMSQVPMVALPYQCYSVSCRSRGEISFKNPPVGCYSSCCAWQQKQQLVQALQQLSPPSSSSNKRPKSSQQTGGVDITLDDNSDMQNGILGDLESDEGEDEVRAKKRKTSDDGDKGEADDQSCSWSAEGKTNSKQKGAQESKISDDGAAGSQGKQISDEKNKQEGGDKSKKADTGSETSGDKKTEVTKVAKIEPDGKTFILGDQRLPLIEQEEHDLHKQAKNFVVTIDNLTFTNIMHGGKLQLTPAVIPELELKRFMVGKTQYQLTLHKYAKAGRSAAKGRFILKKGAIPPVHKFLTKSGKKSLFVLEKYDLHRLARKCGKWEVPGFKYECKMNNVGWIYPCPRPFFRTCWRYRSQNIKSLAAAALQLRIMWCCLR